MSVTVHTHGNYRATGCMLLMGDSASQKLVIYAAECGEPFDGEMPHPAFFFRYAWDGSMFQYD